MKPTLGQVVTPSGDFVPYRVHLTIQHIGFTLENRTRHTLHPIALRYPSGGKQKSRHVRDNVNPPVPILRYPTTCPDPACALQYYNRLHTLVMKGIAKLTSGVAINATFNATFSSAPGFRARREGTVKSHMNQKPSTRTERSMSSKNGTAS